MIILVKSYYKNQDSFCYLLDKKAGKFKEWLDCASLIDMKPNTPVMDVFSYLAYETVGQVRKESVFQCFLYSQTSLIQTPKGQSKVSILERCLLYTGHDYYITLKAPLMV